MTKNLVKKIGIAALMLVLISGPLFPTLPSYAKNPNTPVDISHWWNTEWPCRKLVTIDHTKVSENLTNFPVLLTRASDPDLAAAAQPNGQDLRFIRYTDNTTVLTDEIEYYDHTTGQLDAWIRTPTLSTTQDTKLWMYYGNPNAGSQASQGTWDPNFLSVYHLAETSGTVIDSTANHHNGTPYGSLDQNVAGKIDGADVFDGIDDYILTPQIYTTENQFTLETWLYPESGARYFISQRSNISLGVFLQVIDDNFLQYYINGVSDGKSITLDSWYYVALSYNGSTADLYVNGIEKTKVMGPPTWPAEGMYLSDRSAGNRTFLGILDEVRCSDIARDTGWILTCFTNQNDSAAFTTVGPQDRYQYTLTVQTNPPSGGTITQSPLPPYYYNDLVTLTAIPNPGYSFDHWSGDLTGDTNPTTLLMNGNKTVVAVFLSEQNNTPPVALNDTVTVFENSTDNPLDVLANDYDPDGDTLTITAVSQPSHGASSEDGLLVYYTPLPSYSGPDSFTYTISDDHGGNASATVFLTVIPLNTPPTMPNHPNPENGSTNVSIATLLQWSGGDPDGDVVHYDVYFGTTTSPVKVSSNQSESFFDPGILAPETTYYWQIVAWDTHGASTTGPLWQFTTQVQEQHISVAITRPLGNSFYFHNIRLLPLLRNTIIYGPITITATVTSDLVVDHVEFYIDGKLQRSDNSSPYTYRWAPLKSFKHVIMVKAYDVHMNAASQELTVFKWRFHPLVLISFLYSLEE